MKIYIGTIVIILFDLFSVSYLLPTKDKTRYSDDELRQTALSRNMSSTPNTYEDLLKLVDTPQNRLSKEKIALGKDLYFDTVLSKDRDISCSTCHMISKNQNDKNIYRNLLISNQENVTDCIVWPA